MTEGFLKQLAQARPDPGGGAAAAYGATVGLALLAKVAKLEASRNPGADQMRPRWDEILKGARRITQALVRLREEDVEAYAGLARARTGGRGRDLPGALCEAVRCPVRIIGQAQEALRLIAWAGEHCKVHLLADLLVAAELVHAGLMGAYHIACANLPLVAAGPERQGLAEELVKACQPACELFQKVKVELVSREHDLDPCR